MVQSQVHKPFEVIVDEDKPKAEGASTEEENIELKSGIESLNQSRRSVKAKV